METQASARYVRMSPRKVRRIMDEVRGKNAAEAATILRFLPHAAAKVVLKVLESAMANASHNHELDPRQMVISRIWADGGPVLKRFQPHAQGRAFPIKKRSSHVTVVLSTKG